MLTKLSLTHRVVSFLLGILFAWSAAMQANDPDPGWWIFVYGLLAASCAIAAAWRVVLPLVAIAGVMSFIWSVTLMPGVMELLASHPLSDLVTGMSPDRPYVEEARESLGLLIGALAMAYLAWQARRGRSHTLNQ